MPVIKSSHLLRPDFTVILNLDVFIRGEGVLGVIREFGTDKNNISLYVLTSPSLMD